MTIEPESLRLRWDLLLVRRYKKPPKVGSIYLPDFYRVDGTFTLWEFVKGGEWKPGCWKEEGIFEWREYLPFDIQPDAILRTRTNFTGWIDGEYWQVPANIVEFVDNWREDA